MLDATTSTLRELNEILLRDTNHFLALLQEIQTLAGAAANSDVEGSVQRVMEHVDRIAAWGNERQRAWSEYYQQVHRYLREVVRLDPTRALSQRLPDQLAAWPRRPFHLAVAHAPSILLLRAFEALRALLGEAVLLDPPDYSERKRSLEHDLEVARAARQTAALRGQDAARVERDLATLRQLPLSEDEYQRLDQQVLQLKKRRERLDAGIDALAYVMAHVEERDMSDSAWAEAHLDLWLTVRDWLLRRLPAQLAEVDDPREALLRLRDQLSGLEERLARQEGDLRGASEDVARGIDVQIRKARGQVTRLNKNFNGISFGSIQGIRVYLKPVERMEQVLRALREGAAQALLFQADMRIEQALDEIFRQFGGGRTSGLRLLDYREYVHLQVEIRRKAGADWEVANPTRLSTGEAIGVGAALMMVVLTEWERDATLLRGRKSHGSLRFLFLDEANRLSHDNLGVLFELCQTLELQLLIAAPEVARAEGNTTYRLVRRTTPDGREEVLVSGRRTRADA